MLVALVLVARFLKPSPGSALRVVDRLFAERDFRRHSFTCSSWNLIGQSVSGDGRSRLSDGDQAAIIFSLASGTASRKVCIGVLPKHQRP